MMALSSNNPSGNTKRFSLFLLIVSQLSAIQTSPVPKPIFGEPGEPNINSLDVKQSEPEVIGTAFIHDITQDDKAKVIVSNGDGTISVNDFGDKKNTISVDTQMHHAVSKYTDPKSGGPQGVIIDSVDDSIHREHVEETLSSFKENLPLYTAVVDKPAKGLNPKKHSKTSTGSREKDSLSYEIDTFMDNHDLEAPHVKGDRHNYSESSEEHNQKPNKKVTTGNREYPKSNSGRYQDRSKVKPGQQRPRNRYQSQSSEDYDKSLDYDISPEEHIFSSAEHDSSSKTQKVSSKNYRPSSEEYHPKTEQLSDKQYNISEEEGLHFSEERELSIEEQYLDRSRTFKDSGFSPDSDSIEIRYKGQNERISLDWLCNGRANGQRPKICEKQKRKHSHKHGHRKH